MAKNVRERNRKKIYPSISRTATGLTDFSRKFLSAINASYEEESQTEDFIRRFIKQSDNAPTDAFGEIEFGTNTTKTAKYVKVASTTSVEILYQLLTKHWKLKTPNLIISVTGGAKNFTLRTRLKEVFRKSLIKASESTGAWITTGGTHAGVMKHVGKAVKNYAAIRDDQDRVVTIGIAPWGVIHDKLKLQNHPSIVQSLPKQYDAEESMQGKNVVLDYNHSHFILVDDGSEGKYGTEIDLRTDFESFIADQKTQDVVNVMIVCVIVQGGPGSLKTVAGSIEKGTPVVIVGGSGGWADILAAAYTMDAKSINADVVQELLQEYNMDASPDHIEEWSAMVKTCISNKNLLSVFALDTTNSARDLDIAILEALLKAKDESQALVPEQLKLALAWNRSDIARSHILTDDVVIGKKDLANMFFSALRSNKHKFCKVFLDYGVDLKEYCTVNEIQALYNSAPKDSVVCRKMSKKGGFSFQRVGRLMVQFLGSSYISVYKKRKAESNKYSAIIVEGEGHSGSWRQKPWFLKAKFDDPYREIFQWAILVNYREIAMHVWEYMFGSMPAAIMATKILKTMAAKMSHDHVKRLQLLSDADKYEALAAGIFGQCFLENSSKTIPLLIGSLPKWGGYTCLHVATEANDKHFVSQPGVQSFLDKVWMDKLADSTSTAHVLLAGICPLFIFTTMHFKDDESDNDKDTDAVVGNKSALEDGAGNDIEMGNVASNSDHEAIGIRGFNNPQVDLGIRTKSFTPLEKLIVFYDAPIVTFWMNVLAFLTYLIFFAFVILSDFNISTVSISVYEYILLGWISTFLLEELRQLVDQEARHTGEKIKLHFSEAWNLMDLASLSLFYIGFGLRWREEFLNEALILYAFAFMIHCVHIVHIFAVHRVLGPKIIMVGKMLKDLLFFLFILVVFLLAYGIASQALLYPTEKNFGEIIVGIIYRPYWQIYGELFLDEVNYNPNLDDFTCSNTNASLPRCPQQSVMVPIISALYLLFANVLLLNLLIAMFSYTFENVERQSNEIWMFQRYNLITDYYFRPPLVPPFIVLSHIYHFFAFVVRKISRKMERDEPFLHALKMDLDESDHKQLRKWEHWHAEAFLREKHEEDDAKVDRQLEKLSDRIDNITSSIEDVHDRLQGSGAHGKVINKLNSTMMRRFENLERMIKTLDVKGEGGGVTSFSKSQSKATPPRPPPPIEAFVKKEEAKMVLSKPKPSPQVQRKEPEVEFHVKARISPYPDSDVKRASVPDDKVLWKVEWPEYSPPSYTDPFLCTLPAWADEDLESFPDKERPRLKFNKYDQVNKVNRASYIGTYLVIEGIPRNPRGRTGLNGRGKLGRYGPNHAADPVVTRWKRGKDKQIVKIDDKPVLEFAAVKRADTGIWAIPGGMVDPGEQISATLRREFSEEALNVDGIDAQEIEKIQENVRSLFKSGGLELFRGYCDDHRNTDNAWIETVACNFHDEDGTAFNNIKLSPGEEANKASWKQVDHNLKLFASHYEILKKAAEMHNAHF